MTPAERDAFLAVPRLGMLSTLADDGTPVTVPVWFEWDGQVVRMFSGGTSGKIRRLARDPRASLLVPNSVGERERWVAFDGPATVSADGDAAIQLAERLAPHYWDMTRPDLQTEVAGWRRNKDNLRLLELRPTRIRTGS